MSTSKIRITTVLFLVCLTVFAWAKAAGALPSDIRGHWAEQQISDWAARGLCSGYADGTFKPDNPVTRAEFIALVNRSFGFTATADIAYSDVSSTDWFYNDIARARAAGYITGYEDNTMRPDNPVTRQEVAVILVRLLGIQGAEEGALDVFRDAGDVREWAGASVAAVVKNGLMKGYPDGSFLPGRPITRAEALVSLQKALDSRNAAQPVTQPGAPAGQPAVPGGSGSGGGSGGGGPAVEEDKTPPVINSASLTLSSGTRAVGISGGRHGSINLSGLDGADKIISGTIDVSEASTLTLSLDNVGLPLKTSQELAAGTNNLEIIDYLSYLDEFIGPGGDTLAGLRSFFGSSASFAGTLTDKAGNVSGVTLTITL